MRKQGLGKGGFTLVELVVVIGIMGILAAVVALNVSQVLQKNQITRIQADLKMLETAAYHYSVTRLGEEAIGLGELPQSVLTAGGFLPKIIYSPVASHDYRLTIEAGKKIAVRLEDPQGLVYHQGQFVADTQHPKYR